MNKVTHEPDPQYFDVKMSADEILQVLRLLTGKEETADIVRICHNLGGLPLHLLEVMGGAK